MARLDGPGCGLRGTLGRGERGVVGCVGDRVETEMGWDRWRWSPSDSSIAQREHSSTHP